jgi:hypothetical protein
MVNGGMCCPSNVSTHIYTAVRHIEMAGERHEIQMF